MTEVPRGRFVWYELMTTDLSAAESFYTRIVGWGVAPFEATDTPYTMWMNGDAPVGGLMALPEPAREAGTPPHWIAYISVPDIEMAFARATDLGARALTEIMEEASVGRFAVLADPQGALFALYTPAEPSESGLREAEVGEFSWNELASTDLEQAFGFYEALFGWNKTDAMDMGDMGAYQMYGLSDHTYGGMFTKTAEMPGPPPPWWIYYVRVADVDAAAEMVKEAGGQVLTGPMEVPGGDRIAQCLDPQGAMFALHSKA